MSLLVLVLPFLHLLSVHVTPPVQCSDVSGPHPLVAISSADGASMSGTWTPLYPRHRFSLWELRKGMVLAGHVMYYSTACRARSVRDHTC